MTLQPTPFQLFISILVVASGFVAYPSEFHEEEFGVPTLIPIELSRVRLNVNNPFHLEGDLLRVGKDGSEAIAVLTRESRQCFDLPPGSYQLSLSSGTKMPIPAFAELTSELTIHVANKRKQKSGWCWIPPGPALLGDNLGVGSEDERPVRIVHLPGYWLASTEVTNAQFAQFLSEQPSIDERWIDLKSRKCRIQKRKYRYLTDAPDLPVVMVSHAGAIAYCDWLSNTTGAKCRLPTEQEWEKAARGPESFVFAYGNVYQQSSANQESGKLKNVAQYAPNSFGLFDMTGNAFEWMSNQYDPQSPGKMNQSLRGGSFVLDGMYLRNSFRMRQSPNVMTDDIGFRVLMESATTQDQREE